MKKFAVLLAFSFLLVPALSLAQTPPATPPAAPAVGGPSIVPNTLQEGPYKLVCLIRDVTNWIFTGFLVVAVIFILIAAYYYLIAEGNAEEVLKTHRMLIYSAVGIAVAILSRGFITVVQSVTGVPIQETCASGGPQQGATGVQGNGTQNTNTNTNTNGGAGANNWVQLGFVRSDNGGHPFDSEVQKCSDGLTPGIVIKYDKTANRDGVWANYDPVTGNGGIPSVTHESPQAGTFVLIGTEHTGVQLPFGIGGLGDGYDFNEETCNDGTLPIMQINKSQNGTSWERIN